PVVKGCISKWGKETSSGPTVVKAVAEDGRTNREKMLSPLAAPAHPWARETSLELLSATFDHAGANRPFLFTHFEVVHALMVLPEVGGFACEGMVRGGWLLSGRGPLVGNLLGLTLVECGSAAIEPTMIGGCALSFEQASRFAEVLFGMVPVDQLVTIG